MQCNPVFSSGSATKYRLYYRRHTYKYSITSLGIRDWSKSIGGGGPEQRGGGS